MGFIALITAMFLHSRSKDLLLSVLVRREHVVFSNVGFKDGESRVLRLVKPLHREQASRQPRALGWDRPQAIGELAYGFTH